MAKKNTTLVEATTTEEIVVEATTATTTGNSKYMLNGVKHGYGYCIMDPACGFIVAYATSVEQVELLKKLYDSSFVVVNAKEDDRVQAKISKKEAQLRAKLEARLAALNGKA